MPEILVAFFILLFLAVMSIEIVKIAQKLGKDNKQQLHAYRKKVAVACTLVVLLLLIGAYFLLSPKFSTEIPLIGIMGAVYAWFHKLAES